MNFADSMQNLQKNFQSLTQTISNQFLIVGQMMNKNTARYPANFIDGSVISVLRCHRSHLIFKIIMEILVHGSLTTILKVLSYTGDKVDYSFNKANIQSITHNQYQQSSLRSSLSSNLRSNRRSYQRLNLRSNVRSNLNSNQRSNQSWNLRSNLSSNQTSNQRPNYRPELRSNLRSNLRLRLRSNLSSNQRSK